MASNIVRKFFRGVVLGDVIAPAISRRTRLLVAVFAVPMGMVVGAALYHWGVW